MRIVIIEDEQLTATDLASSIMKAESTAEIVAILGSVKESVKFFNENTQKLDLIFSDIQLGDGLSFEVFKTVKVSTPIVFCTAYDEYALNAFKVNSIHYMLKPFSSKSVAEALSKFHDLRTNLHNGPAQYQKILELLTRPKHQSSLLVYHGEKILPVRIDSVGLFFIENEMTHLVTFDSTRYAVNKTLEELEHIAGSQFFRASRQYLINRKAIKDSSQYFGRKLAVNLTVTFKERITVSKAKVTEFLDWLSEN
ncbi:MAG: LytR/AlgR family response regulator transcription factor [Bacteroidales bacterium]